MDIERTTIWHSYHGSNPHIGEFVNAHGVKSVQEEGYFYYADGAIRGMGTYGQLIEPPSDPIECQQAVVKFWALATQKFSGLFNGYKKHVALYNPDDDQIIETLKEMQRETLKCKRELKAARDKLLCLEMGVSTIQEAKALKAVEDEQAADNFERRQELEKKSKARVHSIRI